MANSKSWNADEEDEEIWDASFPHHTDDMGNYLNPEEPGEELHDAGLSSPVGVTTQADEIEDAEVTETREIFVEDVLPPVASLDKLDIESSLVETSIHEVTPPIEAAMIEHVATTELVSTETPRGEAAKFGLLFQSLLSK